MTSFTDQQVKAALEMAVADKGADYVYPNANGSCVNVEFDDAAREFVPSCIVGHALVNLGVAPGRMESIADYNVDESLQYLGADLSPWARRLLNTAQYHQDYGATWGDAYKKGLVRANEDV